ncbi:probable serine/threonine-protein kinase WNK9 isoform X2 [Malania oleifera]|uniref:probable serine/threonine-protein kinase WNK9 isoform X2 n=1 Tax=Malania oleifera TaxID=397392 RepID=UPI0025AE112F|nr:probable serine/threonine-protein kinase WNK9 isoform X2 [Malania oleifera]
MLESLDQTTLNLWKLIPLEDMEGEILGKGASKTVYRAFDEYDGIEVAWNQVKLNDFMYCPEDLERLYREIHLLKTLKHDNIMKFYTSWVDTANKNMNFVTEMFTSGTLRQYRLKHKRVNIRALKHWCRQILRGLLYLHSHDPPVIHRDIKCDNIFVNGNQGQLKIGDFGLAAILRKSHVALCVGTPEFMAPEVYEEEYNELVDIYAFGMCILEMVTFEYPYSECNHSAQIYKKVISGKKPDALYKVKDPEVRRFVEKCLATVSLRLPAVELLRDPFLQMDNYEFDLRPADYFGNLNEEGPIHRQPFFGGHHYSSSLINSNYPGFEPENDLDSHLIEFGMSSDDLFAFHEDEHLADVDLTIKGKRREDDDIFLRIRIADKEGPVRNIYFTFDIKSDTAFSVATEMIAELDITDQDVTKIADMIDGEIAGLVPEWQRGVSFDENLHNSNASICQNCASSISLLDYLSSDNPGARDLQVLQCSRHGDAAAHGRFEEITYQVEGSEPCVAEHAPASSSQYDGIRYTDIWAQRDGRELSSQESREIHSSAAHEPLDQSTVERDERAAIVDNQSESISRNSFAVNPPATCIPSDDYENEIRQELRWLKAKYQMQLRELRDQEVGVKSKSFSIAQKSNDMEGRKDNVPFLVSASLAGDENDVVLAYGKNFSSCVPVDVKNRYPSLTSQKVQNCEAASKVSYSPEQLVTANSFYSATLLPHSLHRATSLPVDAVDC